MSIHDDKVKEIECEAVKIRKTIIEMLVEAGSGHTAGPLGMADIFAALYFYVLNHKPKDPMWEERDRLILSNGHIVPVRYAAMAHAGYFSLDEAKTLRKLGSRMQGHPEREKLPSMETTSGPLGSGLGQAAGIAYGAQMDNKTFRVYCVMSDAEQQAGNTWESAMFAGNNNLSNLTGIIDRNNIQINGMTEDVMPIEPLRAKYEAFGWHVLEVDGHNIEAFVDAVDEAKAIREKPTIIIAHTIPGKGIPDIEFDYHWHGKPPKPEEAEKFLRDMRTLGGKIDSECI
jgi:transketolase|tara:strand:- start:51925 stop:52782 length:858 start_codon:yes stop_codon:yes gene_type:complete